MSIDPLKRTCECGEEWYFSKWDYVRMLLFDGIVVSCPNSECGRKYYFRLVYHAVREFDRTRVDNVELIEKKKRVWERG